MDEVQKLLDAAATFRRRDGRLTRNERFLWLALFTAAREEALRQLTWDRVDFTTNTIHLNVPGRRITKKRRADVTIASQLRPILERAYEERKNEYVLDNEHSVFKALQVIAAKAGVGPKRVNARGKVLATGIGPHVLRHTAATHMARRGVPLWQIGKILADSAATVERTYAKWVPEDAAGTVDLISGGVLEAAE
jgi:integrase